MTQEVPGAEWILKDDPVSADVAAPQLGDFACLPIAGEVGELIRIGQYLNGNGFRNYEHAEVFVGNPAGYPPQPLGYTMGAYPGGAHLVPVPQDQSDWLWSTGHISLTDEQRRLIVINAMACKGIPYGWLDYYYLAALRLHIPAPGYKAYMSTPKYLICSELVDYAYMKAGVHLFNDGRLPGAVTPEDLANRILNG